MGKIDYPSLIMPLIPSEKLLETISKSFWSYFLSRVIVSGYMSQKLSDKVILLQTTK